MWPCKLARVHLSDKRGLEFLFFFQLAWNYFMEDKTASTRNPNSWVTNGFGCQSRVSASGAWLWVPTILPQVSERRLLVGLSCCLLLRYIGVLWLCLPKYAYQFGNNVKAEKWLLLTPEVLVNSLLIHDFVLLTASFNLVPITLIFKISYTSCNIILLAPVLILHPSLNIQETLSTQCFVPVSLQEMLKRFSASVYP